MLHQLFLKQKLVSTDTRKINPGCIFFALKGENFDANSFAAEALEKGAAYVVIDNKDYWKEDSKYILVNDVLKTLQELAHIHRMYLNLPILSLTGSNGKTTTKELINVVLSQKFKTVATQGNLNNHIGVPLTLLSMDESTEIGIVEMGANHFGEIAGLSKIAAPNFGYITNFGKAHLEGFGSLEGVIKAKSELYDYLKSNQGTAFVNQNDTTQIEKTENQQRIFLEKVALVENDSEFVTVQYKDVVIKTNLVGNYNVNNIEAAISIGTYFGVTINDIKNAIESFKPDNKRSQWIEKGYCKIILDAYNANPTSMEAAIVNFSKNETIDKIVILGDMFELGEKSAEEHQNMLNLVENAGFGKAIFIGERFYQTKSASAVKYGSFEDFKQEFLKSNFDGKTILIKGSRGMALERVLELF